MPTTVTSTGCGVSTVVRSPTARSPSLAAPRSMTTSPGAWGARPSARRYGLSAGSSIQLVPVVGGPSPPMRLAVLAEERRRALDRGDGGAHAGDGGDVVDDGGVDGVADGVVAEQPNVSGLRTTTSMPCVGIGEAPVKPARMVTPRTSVAARKATPRTTARDVPMSRRLRAQRPDVTTLNMIRLRTAFMRSRMRSGEGVAIESTIRPSSRNSTVSAKEAATASWVTITMVWPSVVDRRAHEREDLAAGAAVEVPGRLVGEDHGGARGQRPGHGDALLLAAGELARAVLEALGQADGLDDRADPLLVGPAAGERHRQRDVLVGGQRRQQVEGLEHEADALAADLGQLACRRACRGRCRRGRRGPDVSVSRPARQCMSVDLPEPDGPMTAVRRPAGRPTVTSSRAVTVVSPLP